MPPILYYDLSFRVVGAAMEVHTQLGPGYLENVYQKALAHEFMLRQIQFVDFVKLPVAYKGVYVGDYIADFVVEDKIVVEIKAAAAIHPRHLVQAGNYLAASKLRLAILLNFGTDSLERKRIVR